MVKGLDFRNWVAVGQLRLYAYIGSTNKFIGDELLYLVLMRDQIKKLKGRKTNAKDEQPIQSLLVLSLSLTIV